MDKQLKKLLWDVMERIKLLEELITPPFTMTKFIADRTVVAAAERHFEVIGEALKRALDLHPDLPITDVQKIIGMRNRIAHGYDEVEPLILWSTIKNHIPELKEEILLLVNEN